MAPITVKYQASFAVLRLVVLLTSRAGPVRGDGVQSASAPRNDKGSGYFFPPNDTQPFSLRETRWSRIHPTPEAPSIRLPPRSVAMEGHLPVPDHLGTINRFLSTWLPRGN